jgi:hypothetical protein
MPPYDTQGNTYCLLFVFLGLLFGFEDGESTFSETLFDLYRNMQRYILENNTVHSHSGENLKLMGLKLLVLT